MATTTEYAQFSANVYRNSTHPNNLVGIPVGWTELKINGVVQSKTDGSTGFEARAYTNGSEIVISYAGTDTEEKLNDILIADLGTGLGYTTSQVKQAAEFYTRVNQKAIADGLSVSVTGHSLGGGLAALMGVFFDVNATTFDPAPFRAAAKESNRSEIVAFLTAKRLPKNRVRPCLLPSRTAHAIIASWPALSESKKNRVRPCLLPSRTAHAIIASWPALSESNSPVLSTT